MNAIILTKRNKSVKYLMTSLGNKFKRLKKILEELQLDESLPLPKQDPSLPKKKGKTMELELETYIASLYCNRKILKGVPFMNDLVIEQLDHGLFLIDGLFNVVGVEDFSQNGSNMSIDGMSFDANRKSLKVSRKDPIESCMEEGLNDDNGTSFASILNSERLIRKVNFRSFVNKERVETYDMVIPKSEIDNVKN
nr:hypothetical protein [Tanacetum cinerariifolium]GEZ28772.1 hypothetical protein [Tanacetum cinerariifolium]